MMHTFTSILKMNVKQQFQYRTAAFSGVITQLFFGFMQIALYTAFLQNGSKDFTISQMASYIWLQQCFLLLFKYWDTCKFEISEKIVNGDYAYQLIRPMNLYDYWYQMCITKSLGSFLIRAIPLVIIIMWLPEGLGLMFPVSGINFLLFIFSAMIGALLVTAINMICYIVTMYTLSPNGVFSFCVAIASLFAGQVVPLPMLPKTIQTAFSFLPFRYVSDLPFRIYVGNINGIEAIIQIGIQIFWLILIVLVSKLIMKRKLQKLVVQGG